MKKASMYKQILLVLLAVLMISSSACGSEKTTKNEAGIPAYEPKAETSSVEVVGEKPVYPYTFTDSTGKTITLDKKPENVAVLFSSYVDLWQCAGGETSITVGESINRGFSKEGVTLVDEGTGHEVDSEVLIAAQPDFIIGTTDYEEQVNVCDFCDENGIPSALFKVESFEDYLNVLKIFTDITGDKDAYEKNGVMIEKEIEQQKARVPIAQEQTSILFIRAGSSDKYSKAKTAENHFVCDMLKGLNTHNIAEDAPVLLDTLSLEEILVRDPDYIFISLMGKESAAQEYVDELLAKDGWKDLSAVKNSKCVILPKDLFQYKPNARWAEAYQLLIDALYPEA